MKTPIAKRAPAEGRTLRDDLLVNAMLNAAIEQKNDMPGEKSLKNDRLAKSASGYGRAYLAAAKDLLPDWQHDQIHRTARASAGGRGKSQARVRATDSAKAKLLEEADQLRARLADIEAAIKAAPVAKAEPDLLAILAAIEQAGPLVENAPRVQPDWLPAYQAQQLVAGMDHEMLGGGIDADTARRTVSRRLANHPGYYDTNARQPGLDLDLASGTAREAGYLGLDLYAYDHGTVLHDLDLGIPFDDGQARNVRWVNAPELASGPGGALGLMTEIRRVLMIGGECTYEGPSELLEGCHVPGLQMVERTGSGPGEGTTVTRNVYQRQALRAPTVHGGDPLSLGVSEQDIGLADQMTLAALNAAPARTAMANLLHKSRAAVEARGQTHVLKADSAKQIVYGVVLAPHEIDSQDDYMEPGEIEQAAHHFMQVSRVVGSDHEEPIEAVPVESYVAPQDLTFKGQNGPQTVAKGSWILAVKIQDPAAWAKVLDGGYTGFSVGGMGLREDRPGDTLEGIERKVAP